MDETNTFVKTLKKTENNQVTLWKSGQSTYCVRKCFTGSAEIYRMIAQLKDEALPEIYHVDEKDDVVEVEMEYIEGLTLTEVLSQGTLSQKQTYRVVKELCRVVDVLHENDIVHRDIKPDNILITKENRVVLLDFDSARRFKLYQVEDTRCLGTPGYAAPEQYGVCQTDDRADIYSLGIVLNLMLNGEHPSKKIVEGKWRKVVERCTNINPEKRFATGRELIRALNRNGRRRVGIVASVFFAFLLFVVAGVLVWGNRIHEQEGQQNLTKQNFTEENDTRYQKYVGCWASSEYAMRNEEDDVEQYFTLWMYRCDNQSILFDMVQCEGTKYEYVFECVGQKKSGDIYEFTYQTAMGLDTGRGTLRLQSDKLYLNVYQTEQGNGSEIDVCDMAYDGYLIRDTQDEHVDQEDLSQLLGASYEEAESCLAAMPVDKESKKEFDRYFFEEYIIQVDKTTEKIQSIQCFLYEKYGSFRSTLEVQGVDFTMLQPEFVKKFGTPYSCTELDKGQEMLKYALETKNGKYWMHITFDLQGVVQEVLLEEQEDA
ncbi:MAG: serine/threonine-protein kinase [Clostridiales bacterium]|nr:serine/threonine-protein kinase [Clostridiales bacterium]